MNPNEEKNKNKTSDVNNDEKKSEDKPEQEAPKMRQIIIETDGNDIKITKSEVAGSLELTAILQTILTNLHK